MAMRPIATDVPAAADDEPPPSPNDPAGTILPGDLGNLSIDVNTLTGTQSVGINALLNGNFKTADFGESSKELGQNLVWQYLKGTLTHDGFKVNNDYAGNSPAERLDAVLRACNPQTAYKLLSGQLPDPANSSDTLPGEPVNPQDIKDQKLLQSDVKQLVANGTFTAGDIRELVDAQATTGGDPYSQIGSNGLAAIVHGLPNDAQGLAVKKEFATESLNKAAATKNPDQREFFAAQAATAMASAGHSTAMSMMHALAKNDPRKLNILIQGGLAGQARAEQTTSPLWNPEKTPANGATQLLQWAGDDATDQNVDGPYVPDTGSPQQKQFAARVFNDAMDFFRTDRDPDEKTVSFSSSALPGVSSDDLGSLQDTLLKNDGHGQPSVRLALAEMMDNSFNQIAKTETGGGVVLDDSAAPRLADFARIEFGHYAGDSKNPDWISQYAAQAYGSHLGQLLSGIQQYTQSGSTTSLQGEFPGLFNGDPKTQAREAASLAGGMFGAMSSGILTDTVIVNGNDAANQDQKDRVLAVLGGVLTSAALFVPVFGEGVGALKVASLVGSAGAGFSTAPAFDNSDDSGKGWDPVAADQEKFHDQLNPPPTDNPMANRELDVVDDFQNAFTYYDRTG